MLTAREHNKVTMLAVQGGKPADRGLPDTPEIREAIAETEAWLATLPAGAVIDMPNDWPDDGDFDGDELYDESAEELGARLDTRNPQTKASGGADRNRGGAEKLRAYWVHGAGAAKIGWGTPGDWARCVTLLSEHMGERAKGYCQLRHHDATGEWAGPGAHGGKKGSGPVQSKDDLDLSAHEIEVNPPDEEKRKFTAAQRDRAADSGTAMDDGSFPISNREDLDNAISAYGRAKDKAKAKRHIIARARALDAVSALPESWNVEKAFTHTRKVGGEGPLPPAMTLESKGAGNAVADGVMVAFYAPREVAEAVGHEDPTDMHLTLAYLGKVADVPDVDALKAAVAKIAELPPVTGKVSGVGRFTGDPEEGDPVYVSVDAPDLAKFRQNLVAQLALHGIETRADHGFTPHMTLKYVPPDEPTGIDRIEPLDTTFDVISVAYGPDVWDYPMGEGVTE